MTFIASGPVLVTGATGFIGSALTRHLLEHGAAVVALVKDSDSRSDLVRSGDIDRVVVVNGGLEDAEAVERAIVEHEVETIFHLGAQTIVGAALRSPVATFKSNIEGTWNVLESARRNSDLVKVIVVASSDKAYGSVDELPYTEDTPLRGRGPYDVSKSCTDLIATSYAMTYGLSLAIARCGNVYGAGDLNFSRIVPGTIRSLLRGSTPVLRSDGTFRRDYLHVDDVVLAYLALAKAVAAGELLGQGINFSGESPLTVREIYSAVCEATLGEVVEPIVLGTARAEIRDQYLSSVLARESLGWDVSVDLDVGLKRTVEWYRPLFSDD